MKKKYKMKPGFRHYEGTGTDRRMLEAGEVIEMTPERYRGLRDRFEPVKESRVEEGPPPPKVDLREALGGTVREVAVLIATLSSDELNELIEIENEGPPRKGVIDAATDRLEELSASG